MKSFISSYLKNKYFISREYKIFALMSSLAIFAAYAIFCFLSYQNYQKNYQQKYQSLSFSIANNYEIFLDNILRQSEFIGYNIANNENNLSNQNLLNHKFSVGIDLDMSLISNWINFQFIKKTNNPKIII